MRQVHRKGLATVMLTGGVLAMATGHAQADSHAGGAAAGSPGVLSGNAVQLPVHVPVNVCGNTVNVVGLLNPAAGNSCANVSRGGGGGAQSGHTDEAVEGGGTGTSGVGTHNGGGAAAEGDSAGSPGVLSGNGVKLPVDLPVNLSGNSVNVVGIGNPSIGNTSVNDSGEPPKTLPITPPKAVPPAKPAPQGDDVVEAPEPAGESLAQTGAGALGLVVPAGAATLLGGAVLYRRFRPSQGGLGA
ncbi:chaplin [Streptomyces zhihengii]|uniref:chaplin n=1 Tax=Streptomyces zhihengii TaxID=1818004 RepID=UPI00362E3BBA